jgi:NhaA family Na+:H+ antiporter
LEKTSSNNLPALPVSPIVRILYPFQAFAENRMAGGILLLVCTAVALLWANSRWADSYAALWHTNLTISLAGRTLSHDLHFWVNDLLMAVFFFVVGLEIKREVLVGELASPRQAALPIVAALGGVVVPAIIYTLLNAGGPGVRGWGIPMATDIAFALGAMALLGDRVSIGLKVFLTAWAIVDDIAAVLVIAVFYTAQIDWAALGGAGLVIAVLSLLGRLGARRPITFVVGGSVLWLLVLASGVHATIAGVALGFCVPARTPVHFRHFVQRIRTVLREAERGTAYEGSLLASEEQQAALHGVEEACEKVQPPLHRMEHALHGWVAFFIMPLFALANAGVALSGDLARLFAQPITLGVIFGLLIGKPLGITLAAWVAVRTGLASLPEGVGWMRLHGAGWLGGIGFTMSLFVAGLAFTDERMLTMSKLGILTGSACAAIIGSLLLRVERPDSSEPALRRKHSEALPERPRA